MFLPLLRARGAVIDTVAAYLRSGSSIKATTGPVRAPRRRFHYRLRRTNNLTGCSPSAHATRLALQMALILGRRSGRDLSTYKVFG